MKELLEDIKKTINNQKAYMREARILHQSVDSTYNDGYIDGLYYCEDLIKHRCENEKNK